VSFWVQGAGDIRDGWRVDLVFFFAAGGRFSDDMGRHARGHIGRVRKGNIPLAASSVGVGIRERSSRWRTLQGDSFWRVSRDYFVHIAAILPLGKARA